MWQRDKHYPDEVRLLLKKYNTDPQSMTTKETKVLQDFSQKENIPLNELLGQLPVSLPAANEPSDAKAASPLPIKHLFKGKLYDYVFQFGDIEFGYNTTDNPYKKARELIRDYELSRSLDNTVLETQIASYIQETVKKKAGEQHLDRLLPDEERIRATEEEKKQYESVVRNSNIMIQKKVKEDEARRKKARANLTNLIKLNQQRIRKEGGEVQIKMVNGVLTRKRVPIGIPDRQLSAILLDAERKERLEASQERLKSQQPNAKNQIPGMRKERSKAKRRGMVGLKDLQNEDKAAGIFNPMLPPKEGYFRIQDAEGIKEIPIPKEWDAKLVTLYSLTFFNCNVTNLMTFLRETVKMDEEALTFIDRNIAMWHLRLLGVMSQIGTLNTNDEPLADDSLLQPLELSNQEDANKPEIPLENNAVDSDVFTSSQLDSDKAVVGKEVTNDLSEAKKGVASLEVKDDNSALTVPNSELSIDDQGPDQGPDNLAEEEKLDIDGVTPEKQDDEKVGRGHGSIENSNAAPSLDEKQKPTYEVLVEKIMNVDFETDWTWVRSVPTITSKPVTRRIRTINDLSKPSCGTCTGSTGVKSLNSAPKRANSVVAFSGTGHSLVSKESKENKEAVEEPDAPPGDFSFDEAGEFVTIRFRLATGKQITQKFNTHHIIQDVRNFLDTRHPCGTRLYSLKIQGRPPVLLPANDVRTVKDAKLNRVCILQSRSG